MSMEAVCWIADVLRHPTTGVNALAAEVPKLAAWPVTPPVDVFDEASSLWVAGDKVPQAILQELKADQPGCLIVRRVQVAEGDVLPAGNGFDAVACAVHYLARQTADGVDRDDLGILASQTLKCVRRALSKALPDFVQPQYPTVNGCEIGVPDQNAFTTIYAQAPIEGGLLLDGLIVRLAVWNGWALGIDPTP
jgi:hypothetical protein